MRYGCLVLRSSGLFVWPVGLLQLLIGPIEKPAKQVTAGTSGLVGVVKWILSFCGFERSSQNLPSNFLLDHLVAGAKHFVMLSGALFPPQQQICYLFSGLWLTALIVVGLLLSYRDGKLVENSFWIALFSYASLIPASITVGRAGRGIESATAPRNVTFSALAVIGVQG